MDRLWALKKDHDPFPARVLLRANLFAIIRCTSYRCPYCRWPFKITWGPVNSLLGSGERACWHCRQSFWDGSQEWPEMSGEDRMRFFLPISVAGFIGAFLVVGGIYIYSRLANGKSADVGSVIFFTAFFLPIACWIVFRLTQIIRSVRRYNRRGSVGLA
jgi:hypothetical protein